MKPKGIVGACERAHSWIRVEDRLPEPEQYVLTWSRFCGVMMDYFDEKGFGDPEVTHWMPLPPPPRREDTP